MLILSRKSGETLLITTPKGEVIEVRINSIKGCRVSVGVTADESIKILRGELCSKSTSAQ